MTLSDARLSEARVLRRLAERFAEAHSREPRPAWLVEIMVRDHLAALKEQSRLAANRVAAGFSVKPRTTAHNN